MSSAMAERDPFSHASQNNSDYIAATSSIFIPIHYGDAAEMAKELSSKEAGFLSAAGHISVNQRNNALWIEDDKSNLKKIENYIKKTDIAAKQILISARIVNIDADYTNELGVQYGTVASSSGGSDSDFNMDMPAASISPGQFDFTLAKLDNNVLLDMELSALESEGHGKVISRPKLITLNRKAAYIDAGQDVPYQERTSEGNTNVSFKKAVLSLKVTPVVVAKDKILLHITVNQDKVSTLTVRGVPAVDTREINTQAIVKNKQTIVLGGIYEQSSDKVKSRVPVLSSIPLLGYLFRYSRTETRRNELLIFITPKIIT
ncbi:MAG: secretin [Gammaproteobacteria bacterium]|nr:secretin [Gammaproteobacteria bacterium]